MGEDQMVDCLRGCLVCLSSTPMRQSEGRERLLFGRSGLTPSQASVSAHGF